MPVQRARVVLLIVGVIIVFALATGFPVFHRTYYVLGLLLGVGILWSWLLVRGVDVDVRRPSLRTRAGQSIRETINVRPRSRFVRGFIEVEEQTDMPIRAPGAAVALGGHGTESVELEIDCPQRGFFELGPVQSAGSDPLGLFRLKRSSGSTDRLIVHPATVDLPGFVLLPADLPGDGPVHIRSQHVTTSAFSIREYVPGDSLNRISWKSTARHNRIMVKEFEVEPSNNIWVIADLEHHANSGPAGRAIEETTITIAASISRRYSEGGYPVGFLASGNRHFTLSAQRGSEHLMRIMDALAELRAFGDTSLLNLIGELHARVGRYTSVAIVTPSRDQEWLAGLRHLLQRKSRVTVVSVDGDPDAAKYPDVAHMAATLDIPTYAVKAGTEAEGGLVPLAHGPMGRGAMVDGRARAHTR